MAKPTLATVFTAQDFMSPQIKKMTAILYKKIACIFYMIKKETRY
jgi:hypothetical protein